MTDYINREAAIALTDQHCFETSYDAVWMEEELRKLPAADVVEVVRCKDCINWNGNDCITIYGLFAPRPDDYCSRGEKNSG